jgi:hypothetical protein
LFHAFAVQQVGSGRPAGPRVLYWPTVVVLSFAALEAGLEDLLYASHGRRQGAEGLAETPGSSAPPYGNPRRWLVEDKLQNPNAERVDKILFQDFGVLLGALPVEATFEQRFKDWSKGGSGKGSAQPGPTLWSDLRKYVDTIAYVRNATAHGHASRLHVKSPTACKGALWLEKEDGTWSVQQPHALTALRVVASTFNTVAIGLGDHLGVNVRPHVTSPNSVDYPT